MSAAAVPDMQHTNVVSARDLTRTYGAGDTAVEALRGVSLAVAPGELTAIMGPSGSGKSTLMHILAGLDKPTSGTVSIGGTEITSLDDTALTKLRRQHVGFIFQFFNLLPMLNAEENIVLPLSIAGVTPNAAWVDELIAKVGLTDRRKHRPSELSGGQQQRVAIARALVSRPWISRGSSGGASERSREASSSEWRSPARSRRSRAFSCSTSRSPISIRLCASARGGS